MARVRYVLAGVAAAMIAAGLKPATAEVLDAVYRGTLVCGELPFAQIKLREAIEVTITNGSVRYSHVVRFVHKPPGPAEEGTGSLTGQSLSLQGSWKGDGHQYDAKYSGTFVRRSARLKGTQTWNEGGKAVTRTCSGAIKRPLKAFLPRQKT